MTESIKNEQMNQNERIFVVIYEIITASLALIAAYQHIFLEQFTENIIFLAILGITFIYTLIVLFANLNKNFLSFIPILFQLLLLLKTMYYSTSMNFFFVYVTFLISTLTLFYFNPSNRNVFWIFSILLFGVSFYNAYNIYNNPQNEFDYLVILSIVSLILIAGFLIFLHANRLLDYSITIKIILGSVLVVMVPIIFVVTLFNRSNQQIIRDTYQSVLSSEAVLAAQTINQFIESTIISFETEAKIPAFRNVLQNPSTNNISIARSTLGALAAKNPVQIISYGILDLDGIVLLDTKFSYIGNDESEMLYFKNALLNEESYVSDVFFPNKVDEDNAIFFTTPIKDQVGQTIGILRLQYNANILQFLMIEHDKTSQLVGSYSLLLQELPDNFIQIVNTKNNEILYTTLVEPDPVEQRNYQVNGLLPIKEQIDLNILNTSSIYQPELYSSILMASEDQPLIESPDLDENITLQGYVSSIPSKPTWTLVRFEDDYIIQANINEQAKNIQFYFILIISITIFLSSIIGRFISSSVVRLSETVTKAQEGDLSIRAEVDRNDEVGILSESINYFISALDNNIQTLETTIHNRTSELQTQVERLQTAAEIGQISTGSSNLNELLNAIVFKVSEDYGFYHVGIFMVDDSGEYAELRSTNSEGGWKMLARKHRLKIGQQGVVGYSIATGSERIVQENIEADMTHFFNPDLPNTRSEIALPLITNNVTLGALDVQSIKDNAFSETDISVFKVLANQIALAINNILLLEDLQDSIEAERLAFGQITTESWKKELILQNILGYRSSNSGTYALFSTDQEEDLALISELSHIDHMINEDGSLAVPIKIRDSIIGYLDIDKPEDHKGEKFWSSAEINVILKTTEQLGMTLDNARLYESSQRTSIRERLTTDISTKIWASPDVESILQTTLEEIGRALNISQGSIQIDLTGSSNDSTRGLSKE